MMNGKLIRLVRHYAALAAAAALLLPAYALAQSSNSTFQNPSSINNVQDFIARFLQAIVQIALPILTLFIVYVGFQFVMARGDSRKLSAAKQNFVYVIIGAILILGAWVLATLIGGTVSQVLGTS